jgi:hypothetical protein
MDKFYGAGGVVIIMATEKKHYLAYMLRLWQEKDDAGVAWRASLESPHTGERLGFASLEALFSFLRERSHSLQPQTEADSEQPGLVEA